MAAITNNKPENRVLNVVQLILSNETTHAINSRVGKTSDVPTLTDKREHYGNVVLSFKKKKDLTDAEKSTLAYVRHEIRKLDAKLRPTTLKNILYNRFVNALFNLLLNRQANYRVHDDQNKKHTQTVSAEQNYNQLNNDLAKKGFAKQIQNALKTFIEAGMKAFSIPYTDSRYPDKTYMLNFIKDKNTGIVSLENFDLKSKAIASAVFGPDTILQKSHRFSAIEEPAFTAREAANIADGRPVLKSVLGRTHWFTLDATLPTGMRQIDFDMVKELNKWPIMEMNDPEKKLSLLNRLADGQPQEVTLLTANQTERRVSVTLNSAVNGLHFRNEDGKQIDAKKLIKGTGNAYHLNGDKMNLDNAPEGSKRRITSPKL